MRSLTCPRPARQPNGTPSPVRVAIYCRQSVLHENANGYTSLDAQHAAILAYIESRKHDGWVALDERFDDGGFSGKDMERPALKRLFERVVEGAVDMIAVYRLDRFSRSIADLVRTQSFLEEHQVALASVTEAFDSSSPTGRLMKNLLSSFAQFERETTVERVRDKIASSRRQGLFTGGHPPLGLDVVDGRLVVNHDESAIVVEIFETYRRIGTISGMLTELTNRGITAKAWTNKAGARVGGRAFDLQTLRSLLANPLLAGRIRCGGDVVAAAHPAVVDALLFDQVQAMLAARSTSARNSKAARAAWRHPLQGLASCARCGAPMRLTHARSAANRTHSYFICARLIRSGKDACRGSRVSAPKLESAVVDALRRASPSPQLTTATVSIARDREGVRARVANAVEEIETQPGSENGDARDRDLTALRADLESLDRSPRPPAAADLRRILSTLGPAFDVLLTSERAQLLRLLVREVRVDAVAGKIRIGFAEGLVEARASRNAEGSPSP